MPASSFSSTRYPSWPSRPALLLATHFAGVWAAAGCQQDQGPALRETPLAAGRTDGGHPVAPATGGEGIGEGDGGPETSHRAAGRSPGTQPALWIQMRASGSGRRTGVPDAVSAEGDPTNVATSNAEDHGLQTRESHPPAPVDMDYVNYRRVVPMRDDPTRPSEREALLLPRTPARLVWRHPGSGTGLRVQLLDEGGLPWPSEVLWERHERWTDVRVTPTLDLPEGAVMTLRAEEGAGTAQVLWRVALRVEEGWTGTVPWKAAPASRAPRKAER